MIFILLPAAWLVVGYFVFHSRLTIIHIVLVTAIPGVAGAAILHQQGRASAAAVGALALWPVVLLGTYELVTSAIGDAQRKGAQLDCLQGGVPALIVYGGVIYHFAAGGLPIF